MVLERKGTRKNKVDNNFLMINRKVCLILIINFEIKSMISIELFIERKRITKHILINKISMHSFYLIKDVNFKDK